MTAATLYKLLNHATLLMYSLVTVTSQDGEIEFAELGSGNFGKRHSEYFKLFYNTDYLPCHYFITIYLYSILFYYYLFIFYIILLLFIYIPFYYYLFIFRINIIYYPYFSSRRSRGLVQHKPNGNRQSILLLTFISHSGKIKSRRSYSTT